MSVTAYISLGSNMGEKARTLIKAVKMIDEISGVEVKRISQFIKTAPVGGPAGQEDYLNGVTEIVTDLAPERLLDELQWIERRLGRDRDSQVRWGPRTCDLDILLMGELVIKTQRLTIPHARLTRRKFVLAPLAQIAPDVVEPVSGKTAGDLLDELSGAEG